MTAPPVARSANADGGAAGAATAPDGGDAPQVDAAALAPEDAPPSGTSAALFGCAGPALSADEAAFFRDASPLGFILFARNLETPDQTRALTDALRNAVGWRAPVLIDQEGGRVARLRGPTWREWAPVGAWCDAVDAQLAEELKEEDAGASVGDGARPERSTADPAGDAAALETAPHPLEAALWEALALRYRLIAHELTALGVDVDCAPLLDVRTPGGHDVIGDRALGWRAATVAARAEAVCGGLEAGGVLPVLKHIPGHGRAEVDSHESLPEVDAPLEALRGADFAPFRALRARRMAMTAHVLYRAVDPDRCATLSPRVVGEIIRGEIGFDGLLMTDDLSMGALEGDVAARTRESLAAGCDVVLHCNGDAREMRAAALEGRALEGDARRRAEAALAERRAPEPLDEAAADARVAALSQGWTPRR